MIVENGVKRQVSFIVGFWFNSPRPILQCLGWSWFYFLIPANVDSGKQEMMLYLVLCHSGEKSGLNFQLLLLAQSQLILCRRLSHKLDVQALSLFLEKISFVWLEKTFKSMHSSFCMICVFHKLFRDSCISLGRHFTVSLKDFRQEVSQMAS